MGSAKIMMVDDEPLNMEMLQIHLEAEGYNRFVCHADSTTALEAIRHEQPDALILDLKMPGVTGFDILQEMQLDSALEHIPIIVLTSSNDAESKLKTLQLGATDFLAKPVDASELALRVRNTLITRAYQQRLMHIDSLTNLPNRLCFMSVAADTLEAVADTSDELAMILINISRFKSVNDLHGPERGNDVLWAFSQRLKRAFEIPGRGEPLNSCLGDTGFFVARVGGDRFALLLPVQSADEELTEVKAALNSLLKKIEEPYMIGDQKVHLSFEVGVTTVSRTTDSVEYLINQAETALIHAKLEHDTNIVFYADQMDEHAREQLSIENGIRSAIDNGELFLVYQPKVDVQSGCVVGAEALVRWTRPSVGVMSPVDFIPLAESTGLIVPIGHWVLKEACRQAVVWRASGEPDFKVAVNVSVRQLYAKDFIETVAAVLQETGLPPEALILELTENMIMENAEHNIDKLQSLKALGVSISIDDFGTGYSSLSYLQRFPIDQLKIDRGFISEIQSANELVPIVKAVISLAHDLRLDVVAEGVETPLQLAHLKAMRCEQYQGYLFSRPVIAAEFTDLLMMGARKSA